MDTSLDTAISFLQRPRIEGGYVNDPHDPGKCTSWGVTLATFRRYVMPNGTCADLRRMTLEQAKRVYRDHYWRAVWAHKLPAGVDLMVFDFGVNAGPHRAVTTLQRLVGVRRDGIVGPMTLRAVDRQAPADLIRRYATRRRWYYRTRKLCWRYCGGWLYRVDDCERISLKLADQAPAR